MTSIANSNPRMAANRIVLLRVPMTGGAIIPRALQVSQRSLALTASCTPPVPTEVLNSVMRIRIQTAIEMVQRMDGPADSRSVCIQEVCRMLSGVPVNSEPGTVAVTFVQFSMANFVVAITRDPTTDVWAKLQPPLPLLEPAPVQQTGLCPPPPSRPLIRPESKKRKECDTATNNESPFNKKPSCFGNPRRYRGTSYTRAVLTSSPPATLDRVAWEHSNTTDVQEPVAYAASPPGSSRASVLSEAFYWPPPSDTTGTSVSTGYNCLYEIKGGYGERACKTTRAGFVPPFAPHTGAFVQKPVEALADQGSSTTQKAVEKDNGSGDNGQSEFNISSRGDWFGADTMLNGQGEEDDANDQDDGYWAWDRRVQRFRHWDDEKKMYVYCPETFD